MTDNDYYALRAEQEALLATKAVHPAAVQAHYRLSTAYLERADPSSRLLRAAPASDHR